VVRALIVLPGLLSFLVLLFVSLRAQFSDPPKRPPIVINQSENYDCRPINDEWSRCKNLENNISFEYPINWKYIDGGFNGIGFSPSEEQLKKDIVVLFFESYGGWKTRDDAEKYIRERVQEYDTGILSEKDVNGFHITDLSKLDSDDSRYYLTAYILKDNVPSILRSGQDQQTVSEEELRLVWDHMINSLKKENN
jgi:hypothetical protein